MEVREISTEQDLAELKSIIKLLVGFDEATGRCKRYPNQEMHFLRKAFSVCEGGSAFLQKESENVYHVVVSKFADGVGLATAWSHEDGIAEERKTAEPGHPVHKIVCVGDLWERAKPAGDIDGNARVLLLSE